MTKEEAYKVIKELISREDAIEVVAQQWLFEASTESPYVNDDDIGEYRNLAEGLFEDVPTIDAVEVVRCGECKHRYGDDCPMYYEEWFTIDEGDGFCDSDFYIIDETQDDGFCYCGERGET